MKKPLMQGIGLKRDSAIMNKKMKRLISFLLMQVCCATLMFAQTMVFKPTSATIKDQQGSYTSQQFDCPNMLVNDNNTTVDIAIAGDKMTLYPNQYNKDAYISVVQQGNTEVKAVAYRSSSSNKIYLVVMTTKYGDKSVTINFKT